jgi:hypothetical protein
VRALTAAAILLTLLGCRDPLGRPCQKDEDCGPGFDCFPDVCVRVCTKDTECDRSQTCYRYHCVTPGQERGSVRQTPKATPPNARPTPTPPPPPDVTAAELRAIRRELELLRREQSRLAEAVERMRDGADTKKPAKAGPVKLRKGKE